MTPLIICSIIAIIGIACIVIGVASDDGGFCFAGFMILLFDGLIGFGLICSLFPASSSETLTEKFSYAKTQSVVIIETPSKNQTFTDAYTYNTISDSSKVFLHADYNTYGCEVRSYLIVR